MRTALIHGDQWARFDYGPEHPLRMERLGLTWRLMEAYDLTSLPDAKVLEPPPADETAIGRFHTAEYIDVLRQTSCHGRHGRAALHGLGAGDNPIFPGLWEASQLAAGGSLLAAQLVAAGDAARAFHFAGGLHHAMPDRASGFCYVNDAVLAILYLRDRGLRVAYVDIDAHHGDGVQFAFYDDPRVLTISIHERGEHLFPGTGFVDETGIGDGLGYAVNMPLEAYSDDPVYEAAFEAVVPRLLQAFRPDVVVAQLGIDSHRTDPLTHLALDVQGFARAVRRIVELAPRLVALGGGGYDLSNVARAWTVAWAAMNGVELADSLPTDFAADARRFGFRSLDLWDPPSDVPESARRRAREYADRQVEALRHHLSSTHHL